MADLLFDIPENASTDGRQYSNQPVVEQYDTIQGIEYPSVMITSSQEHLQRHMLMALQNYIRSSVSEHSYPVYLRCDGQVNKLGNIDPRSLKRLLQTSVFSVWNIVVLADENTVYTDDLRLAFCYG